MIAIHDGKGWNARWIEYCRDKGIPHKIVNAYDSDVVEQIRDCKAFMWHFHHNSPRDILMARNVLNVAEKMGLKVFPDFNTNWHFDDKLSQKYLSEALALPVAPSWAFYDLESALKFAKTCEIPIVAKLRRGAGSHNVRLLRSREDVEQYVHRMFGAGYKSSMHLFTDVKRKFRTSKGLQGIVNHLKRIPDYVQVVRDGRKYLGSERGYVYFQKFIAGNTCDIRVSIIRDRAWAFKRMVRKNDFRASGSGVVEYDIDQIPEELIKTSYSIVDALGMQSACLDWVHDPDGQYYFVEVSYGFVDELVYNAPGWWDRRLNWHFGHLYPSIAILEDMIGALDLEFKCNKECTGVRY